VIGKILTHLDAKAAAAPLSYLHGDDDKPNG